VRALLEFLIRSLVDDPDAVAIEERPSEGLTVLRVRVATADIGKVIGRQGRTIKAIRALMSAAERRLGQRASVELVEDE
jgi:predicted RNA-binding protein YlqC (UPF0109 family)